MEVRLIIVLAGITVLSGCACQTTFRDHPASSTVLLNFPTSLSCSANLPYPGTIVWQFNGTAASRGNASYDSSTGRSVLTLAVVSYNDAGNYTCLALDGNGNLLATSEHAVLTVQGPPIFVPSLSAIAVQEGGTAVIRCSVISNPPSSLTWFSETGASRQLLTSGDRILISPANRLTISNVQQGDNGFYTCLATNTFGSNATTGRLILAALTPLEVTVTPSEPNPLELTEGGGVTLRCTATVNVSISSISWSTQSGRVVTSVSPTSNVRLLSISPATPADSDIYTCSAVDFQGRNASYSIEVVVVRTPTFTTEPSDVTGRIGETFSDKLECVAAGIPPPTITWLDPNLSPLAVDASTQLPLIAGGGSLARSHSGVYTCVAINSAGVIRSEFTLTVQAPPVFSTTVSSITTPPDRDVTLSCTADGSPTPAYSWSKVDGLIPQDALQSSTTGDLRLFGVTSDTTGVYTCMATNELGVATSTTMLTVLPRPSILRATTSPVITLAGSSFSLECIGTGPSETELNWYLNGTLLNQVTDNNLVIALSGQLTVSRATTAYSGFYTCNVSTSFAFATAQVHVIVGVQPSIVVPPANTDLVPGSSGFLECIAVGTPTPYSRWSRTDLISGQTENLGVIGPSHFQLSTGLQLQNVGRNDSGTYECLVENLLGMASTTATVRVEAAPIVSSISPTSLVAGETSTLICSTTYNFPTGNFAWSQGDSGDPLPVDRFTVNADGSLVVSPVSRQDEGPLTCSVTNQYGCSTVTAQVMVQYAPTVNITGGATIQGVLSAPLTLSCDVRGQPLPSISWVFPDGRDTSTVNPGKVQFNSETGTLTIGAFETDDAGSYTCRASNVFGTGTEVTVVTIVGPAIQVSALQSSITEDSFELQWEELDFVSQGLLDIYEVWTATHSRTVNEIVSHDTYRFFLRSGMISGLSPGTVYNVTVRGVYLNDIVGLNNSILVTTPENFPTGPPLNLNITAFSEGGLLQWMPPAESLRNGIISGYTVEYRLVSEVSYTTEEYVPDNLTLSIHYYTISGLDPGSTYEARVSARTAVGSGPFTTNSEFVPLAVFQPLNGQVLAIVIGVGAAVGGVAFITAVVLLVSLVACFIYKKRTKEGKHRPLVDPEKGDKENKRKKNKTISGPIPGITPQVDSSVQGKFTIQGQDGRTIQLKPKVITSQDVAPRPKKGDRVKKVTRKDTILAPSNDETDQGRIDPYHVPADALKSSARYVQQRLSSSPGTGRVLQRPESSVYSEVSDQPLTPPTGRRKGHSKDASTPPLTMRTAEVTDNPYEEVKYRGESATEDTWGRTAAEESEDGSQQFLTPTPAELEEEAEEEAESERAESESESPVPPEAPDVGRDDSQLLYSTVPQDYVDKKREKKKKEQEALTEKQVKQRNKMEEKMEREKLKQEEKEKKKIEKEEAKVRKQMEEERKKRAKDAKQREKQRESMGLSNIVTYQDIDITKGRSQAQAQFIDTATAALF